MCGWPYLYTNIFITYELLKWGGNALGRRLKRAPGPLAEILDTDPNPDPSFFETELEKLQLKKSYLLLKNSS